MTGTKTSMKDRMGALLAAAIMVIGVLGIAESKSLRSDAPAKAVSHDVLRADGGMPPPAPLPLPKPVGGGGHNRA